MNTEFVFFDDIQMAKVVFLHVAIALLDSFKKFNGKYMNMALIFNGVENIDPAEFYYPNYEMIDFVQLNGYIRKERDRHVTQSQFCGIAILQHEKDATSLVVIEMPGDNVRYQIKIERNRKPDEKYDVLETTLTHGPIFITNLTESELSEWETSMKYYEKIIATAVAEIVENQSLARIIETEDGRQMFEYNV